MLVNEELCAPLSKPQGLIFTFVQTIDIGLRQRWMKNEKNAYCHKRFYKSTFSHDFLCVLKLFQYISTIQTEDTVYVTLKLW